MTPLTQNPKVVLLVKKNEVAAVATNVAPDLEVVVTNTESDFKAQAAGLSFDTTRPETVPVLS